MFASQKVPLKLIPVSHPLYSAAHKIEEVEYRPYAKKSLGNIRSPRLRGMEIGGRMAVIFSGEDLSAGLVGQPVDGVVGYMPGAVEIPDQPIRFGATELMTNILLYASKVK
jgi:hypothetical protein